MAGETKVQRESATSENGRFKPGMLGAAGEHSGSDLNAIMKSPDIIGERGVPVPQLDVRAGLGNRMPADPQKRLIDSRGFRAGPAAHAEAQIRLIDSGTIFDFSTRSAITRRASA